MPSVKEYNIVLLGETGTGKSLFINSFANYFHFDSLKEAIASEERVNLISSNFGITDSNNETHEITSGENDGNERTKLGESMTVNCRSYKFQLGEVSVRLIDTPGVGDTEGEEVDKRNVANILNYINNFENLHAIAIVVRNTEYRLTDRYSYCLKSLITILNKTAVDNIVFILTYAKSNDFKPGPIKDVIKRFIEKELKDSLLKLDKDHVYCFDNKCYEYLIATQQEVKFDQDDYDSQGRNWQRSSAEMRRLLKHVTGLSSLQYDIADEKMRKALSIKQELEENKDKIKSTANNSQYRSKEYNILLLGETGTGKSQFINSFANYYQFDSLREAIENNVTLSLIPSTFEVTDSNYEDHVITSGENDGNERLEIGKSFTINCKSYKFQSGDVSVRLIDTPGLGWVWLGDAEGEEANRTKVTNTLSYINNFENLHAIAIVIKNTENKMTDRFRDCLKTLLTNLSKSAVNNIVFIFTYVKGNNFKPGEVKEVIKNFFESEVRHLQLRLDKYRMYCMDNKCYEFLMAINKGVQFDQDDHDSQTVNWKKSSDEVRRLITYVKELTPHKVKETVSLNDARQFMSIIHPFLITILKNIDENTKLVNEYEENLLVKSKNVKDMKSDVNLKQIDIKIVPIHEAITFCVSQKCREKIVIKGEEKYHYPKQCCKGCVVSNNWRWQCRAIDWKGYCKKCGCHKDEHQRRFYKTETITTDFFTDKAIEKINKANSEIERVKVKIESLKEKRNQLIEELRVIEDAEKKFVKFLQVHALTKPPEQRFGGSDSAYYTECVVSQKYENEIAQIECMSIDEFYMVKTNLITLPINGKKFQEILKANAKGFTTSAAIVEVVKMYLPNKF